MQLVDKIFVCHHKPLIDRKERLLASFEKYGIQTEWIESFSPYQIRDEYDKLVGVDYLNFGKNKPAIQQGYYKYHRNNGRKVSLNELSLYLKHKFCLEKQVLNGYKTIIIFEDDIIFNENSLDLINKSSLEFALHKPKLDIAMIGTAFGFEPKVNSLNKVLHFNKYQLTRCTHAMMFSLEGSYTILNELFPINWPIDFKLNEIIIKKKLKVGWTIGGILQNTAEGKEQSAIQIS